MPTTTEHTREQQLRRAAEREGLRLEKNRTRDPNLGGTYQLVDAETGFPAFADWATQRGYGLTLDDIADHLSD